MAARLRVLEAAHADAQHQLRKAQQSIARLRAERDSLRKAAEEAAGRPANGGLAAQVERVSGDNFRLRKQIHEMETFLNDYGLVWVGSGGDEEEEEEAVEEAAGPDEGAVVARDKRLRRNALGGFDMQRDLRSLQQRIEVLNERAGDGQPRIAKTADGAHKFVDSDTIALSLFSDGIMLRRGPFRPLSDERTMAFLADIMEGYFPFEFKDQFPHGVVFDVHKHADKTFEQWRAAGGQVSQASAATGKSPAVTPFAGQGQRVGDAAAGAAAASPAPPAGNPGAASDPMRMTFQAPELARAAEPPAQGSGPRITRPSRGPAARSSAAEVTTLAEMGQPTMPMSAGRLLAGLPETAVTRSGRVVQVRGPVAAMMGKAGPAAGGRGGGGNGDGAGSLRQDMAGGGEMIIADTEVVRAIQAGRVEEDVATLRVKSDSGRQTILIKLRFSDTIATVRRHIDQYRTKGTPYELRTAFPNRTYSDHDQTLVDAGLTPNANMMIRKI